jgi:hypothetical protein
LEKKISTLTKELKKEQDKPQVYTIPIRLPEQSGNANKYLRVKESGGAPFLVWDKISNSLQDAFDDFYFDSGDGLVFKTPDGSYYLLTVANGGVLQTTKVTP